MTTFFDFVTVGSFLILILVYYFFTSREPRILLNFLLCAGAFAIANQLGNAGSTLLALTLLVAGIGYAVIVWRAS